MVEGFSMQAERRVSGKSPEGSRGGTGSNAGLTQGHGSLMKSTGCQNDACNYSLKQEEGRPRDLSWNIGSREIMENSDCHADESLLSWVMEDTRGFHAEAWCWLTCFFSLAVKAMWAIWGEGGCGSGRPCSSRGRLQPWEWGPVCAIGEQGFGESKGLGNHRGDEWTGRV